MPIRPLELWGGVECTINRVHNDYIEQLGRAGHLTRLSDFDLFKSIGITTLRQPILWEMVASDAQCSSCDWTWPDAALRKIRELRIRPIAGLLHHGSGPFDTNLLDPQFPDKFVHFAQLVAQRYPWIEEYTPVNEPLTTARFSGLYGHWYPHGCDDLTFCRALLNQCKAVVLAMRAIRAVQPNAKLIQTEDIGKIFSTPRLRYQADFENERRWLSFDLLCGVVDTSHPMWSYFLYAGIPEDELQWFLDNPCPPQVLGVNHYLSGQRYLDEHVERYPNESHAGNGREQYVDVLATRVLSTGPSSIEQLLMEVWRRYKVPIAITECHNACTREEQLRWFNEVWQSARASRARGAKVIAVTAWSLLGAYGWDELVRKNSSSYEVGAFDVCANAPRRTALAHLISSLTRKGEAHHPLLDVPGWWSRPERHIYGFSLDNDGCPTKIKKSKLGQALPLAISATNPDTLSKLSHICSSRGIPSILLSNAQMRSTIHEAIHKHHAWAIVQIDEGHQASATVTNVPTDSSDLEGGALQSCIVADIQYDSSAGNFPRCITIQRPEARPEEIWLTADNLTAFLNSVLDLVIDTHFEAWARNEPMPQAVLQEAEER